MDKGGFSEDDLRQIREEGLAEAEVRRQWETFRRGVRPLILDRPCRVGDGIETVDAGQMPALAALNDSARDAGRITIFVPASGAATRMFQDWFRVLEAGDFASRAAGDTFARELPEYAFYPDLAAVLDHRGTDVETLLRERGYVAILEAILTSGGLNYGRLPKALLKFHASQEGGRTALEEHLVEAALYAGDAGGVCRIHFTVSEEHLTAAQDHLRTIQPRCEARLGRRFQVTLSTQNPATHTLAVDLEDRPFRTAGGRLVFRPAGHGALLGNLLATGGDLVFIKNIDNIVPDRLKARIVPYKKLLGGVLLSLQREIFRFQRRLAAGDAGTLEREQMIRFCRDRLHVWLPADFPSRSPLDQAVFLQSRFARPLRVCGVVPNAGEPGGGPFWVRGEDGAMSLQIVEAFQVDSASEAQQARWAEATHFNPVDLVCGLRDEGGRLYDLDRFVDRQAGCITLKSEAGHPIKALELPGLWNGAMAYWNTVFVEVPLETFNPVKTVTDLLRPQHRQG